MGPHNVGRVSKPRGVNFGTRKLQAYHVKISLHTANNKRSSIALSLKWWQSLSQMEGTPHKDTEHIKPEDRISFLTTISADCRIPFNLFFCLCYFSVTRELYRAVALRGLSGIPESFTFNVY